MSAQQDGFTFIEVLITTFIIATVMVGLFGLFDLSVRVSSEAERQTVAVALGNEQAELVRNLPYAKVGTVGGAPSGAIVPNKTITRNGVDYTVTTDIRYVDDSYDGTITSSPVDVLNTDYKLSRIEVIWKTNVTNATKSLLLITYIAPPGIEGSDVGGTLVFTAIDSSGNPLQDATLTLKNSSSSPAINIITQTNENGLVVLPGLPPGNGSYSVSVTKNGYTEEKTYSIAPTFIPDAEHSHLSIIQGQFTEKTFVIDHVSDLTVATQDAGGAAIGSVPYHIKGTKTIGVDGTNNPVYLLDEDKTTDASGQSVTSDMVWDTYAITIDALSLGYDIKETSWLLPLTIAPNTSPQLTVTLVPHTPLSLHVTALSPTNQPIENASVQVLQAPDGDAFPDYDQTMVTGTAGQVFFADMPVDTQYTVTVTTPGYETKTETINVNGSIRIQEQLTPIS